MSNAQSVLIGFLCAIGGASYASLWWGAAVFAKGPEYQLYMLPVLATIAVLFVIIIGLMYAFDKD